MNFGLMGVEYDWFSCCYINGQMRAKNAKVLTLLNLKYDNNLLRFYFMKPCKRAPLKGSKL